MSPEGRKRIGDAARRRWAEKRAGQEGPSTSSSARQPAKKASPQSERRLTPAGRKRLSDLMKARWASKKAADKSAARGKSATAKTA
ncbi:MAG: hypothetical protein M3Y07_02465 [Acidobacteriota bacterium]|nr:hypothetical protein [Acidobacteriota bacterium]